MKELFLGGAKALFDLRLVVGVCGVVLSVVMHELFHVIVHWGEVRAINLFPDSHAIVEVLFVPTGDYDLAVEEALAYAITMVTLVLTAMLIGDIHDARDTRTVSQTILATDSGNYDELQHLSDLLGAR